MQSNSLPLSKQIVYAFGMMGWSIMINLISVILVYLYAPPANSGFPLLITQVAIFGFFNVISIITTSGRLVDAVYDPLIAQWSDSSKHPKGRRTPFMKWAILPSLVFCCLVFYPLHQYQSSTNIVWLVFMLIGFYASTTTYIIPYNALLPELANTAASKVRLATWQSVGYIMGIGTASSAFNITDALQQHFHWASKLTALQVTVFLLALLGSACMAVPALGIDERKMVTSKPTTVPMKTALRETLGNKNFIYFIIADFSYWIAITLITSGLLFFLKVLLLLPETLGVTLMASMVGISLLFYPLVNIGSRKIGNKPIVIVSLLILSLVFGGVYFLGKINIDPTVQIFVLIGVAAIPFASLNILPNAILSEVIEEDRKQTGNNKEAIYFAVRYFFVKIAQALGMGLFAMLLIYGKDVGHDLGIRLNGILGFALCLMAAVVFSRFKEKK